MSLLWRKTVIYFDNPAEDFYNDLIDQYGESELNRMRKNLMVDNTTDEEWMDYCFSNESPF